MTNKYMKSTNTTCHSGNANEQHEEILEQVIPNVVTKSNVGENMEQVEHYWREKTFFLEKALTVSY